MSHIMKLWQEPNYKGINLNIYEILNSYLLTRQIIVNQEKLKKLGYTKKEFLLFLINFYNNIICEIKSDNYQDDIILYRGEYRKNNNKFNYKIGDIFIYNTVSSFTDTINFAYNFSQNIYEAERLLFQIKFPKKYKKKKLITNMITFDKETGVTTHMNESEFLIPPNCYYQIIDIQTLNYVGNIKVIKAEIIFQEIHMQLDENDIYINKKIVNKLIDNFKDVGYDNFIYKLKKEQEYISLLNKLKKFSIPKDLYYILIVNKQWPVDEKIFNLVEKSNKSNWKQIAKQMAKYKFTIHNYELEQGFEYVNKIFNGLKLLKQIKFKMIDNIILYKGFYNIENSFNEDPNKKMKNNNIYNNQLCRLDMKEYLYEDMYYDQPRATLEKNNKKVLQYYDTIIKMNCSNVKIAVNETFNSYGETHVILFAPLNITVVKQTNIENKFKYPVKIIEINATS